MSFLMRHLDKIVTLCVGVGFVAYNRSLPPGTSLPTGAIEAGVASANLLASNLFGRDQAFFGQTCERVRTRIQAGYEQLIASEGGGFSAEADLGAADEALAEILEEALERCLQDRETLARAAVTAEGLTNAAVRIVMAALEVKRPDLFSSVDPESLPRRFAQSVVQAGVAAVAADRAFYSQLTPDMIAALGRNLEELRREIGRLAEYVAPSSSLGADRPPFGFSSLASLTSEGLRGYLHPDRQAYYGWAEHARLHPPPVLQGLQFAGEETLLEHVLRGPKPLVIHGAGGAGKSRLALELGRLAAERDWIVWRPGFEARREDLREALVWARETGGRLLLLVDYVEEMGRDFSFDALHEEAARHPEILRFIACCRSSWLKGGQPQLRPRSLNARDCDLLELTPPPDRSAYGDWLAGWRAAACRAIDAEAGARFPVPVLTVLSKDARRRRALAGEAPAAGDEDDLAAFEGRGGIIPLLTRRRTDLRIDPARLTRLLVCHPMSPELWLSLAADPENERLLGLLTAEGWAQREETSGRWALGHDLICDLQLIAFLTEDSAFAISRLGRLFAAIAAMGGAEESFRTALRRVLKELAEKWGAPASLEIYRHFQSRTQTPPWMRNLEEALERGFFSLSLSPFRSWRCFSPRPA